MQLIILKLSFFKLKSFLLGFYIKFNHNYINYGHYNDDIIVKIHYGYSKVYFPEQI